MNSSAWETAPLEDELVKAADRLVGGPDAVLVVDDTALVKPGKHSVGVKRQYCGQLGKKANCQAMVSLTLAGREVPVCVGLRLFLPENWAGDAERRRRAGVPEGVGPRPKWRIALDEIGKAAEFRAGLAERRLAFAVGILPTQKVYPADVALTDPARNPTGRPRKHPVPSAPSVPAAELFEARPELFRTISWRAGTMIGSADHLFPKGCGPRGPQGGPLRAEFAALRVRVADGPVAARAQHLPGAEAWLVGEHRAGGERKYYLANLPADALLETLAALIKARPRPAAAGRACGNGSSALRSMGLRTAASAAQGRAGAGPFRGPLPASVS